VWAVEIDEAFADFFQERQRDGGVVDELAVGCGADGAPDDNLFVLTGFKAAFFENGIDFGGVLEIKNRLDGAGVFTGADQAFIGTLSENHFKGSDDNRFSSTGFASDRDEAGAEFPYEFVYEGEVADFEKGEHVVVCGREYAVFPCGEENFSLRFPTTAFEILPVVVSYRFGVEGLRPTAKR
jgi:hypothetical protein